MSTNAGCWRAWTLTHGGMGALNFDFMAERGL
jgi:hypothetical protein